ncbi:sigma-E processing peptidase SpoIIGA [Lihuaxuella thermophila]|uniref:Sporulation sigma-E factor-processing peptidase n=1 Tax=Lihuaxuella thermophila TaxID=1173111 RepID=A0A1H8DNA1_9BACL|nr:sigma-E processing peptidase SpoIIGA [Lihuaxuella thermophila]SEN08710.1 stage II sporulation protein GA (sporulation sigma-E factor processing peptidase) [Lihuaxuella thermophila]
MTVYADLIFLLNGCIDFLLLWLTSGIRKQKTSYWRLLLAAMVGGIYSMLHLWPVFSLAYFFPVKILVSMVMVWVAYGFCHPLAYLRNLGVFYLVCFIAGGAMIALHYVITGDSQVAGGVFFTQSSKGWGSPVSWLLILFGFPLVWAYTRFSLRSLNERQSVHQFLTRVKIFIDGKELECTGLVDTGNQLRDPMTRTPVMMVELERIKSWIPHELKEMAEANDWEKGWLMLPPEWMARVRVIPYRAAGSKGNMMIAFKPDHVQILQENKWNNVDRVLIGIDVGHLSSDGTYQAIIHPSCLSV